MPQGQNFKCPARRSEFELVFPELGFDNLQTRVDLETLLAGDQAFCRHQTRGAVRRKRNVTNDEINGCFDVPKSQNSVLSFADIAGHWINRPTQFILGCAGFIRLESARTPTVIISKYSFIPAPFQTNCIRQATATRKVLASWNDRPMQKMKRKFPSRFGHRVMSRDEVMYVYASTIHQQIRNCSSKQ